MRRKLKVRGFSLIELIVVLAILGLFIVGVLLVLNPQNQLNKTYDAERINDLNTISSVLDSYYNDNNSYPQSIPFGQKWGDVNSAYMQKIPNDPQALINEGYCYFSDTTSSSPQWEVLFAKLVTPQQSSQCSLQPDCEPQGFSNQWACKTSGKVDCSVLSQDKLPCAIPTPLPTQPITPPQNRIMYSYGFDGSSCQQTMDDNMNMSYCTDSTGFDSRTGGVNTCNVGMITRYGCSTYSSGGFGGTPFSWGVKCAGVLRNCNAFYGTSCQNNICIAPENTTKNPPQISILSPLNNSQIQYGQNNLSATVHVDEAYDTINTVQVYFDGLSRGYCSQTEKDTYTCSFATRAKAYNSFPSANTTPLLQVFAEDNSGNVGYTQVQLHY